MQIESACTGRRSRLRQVLVPSRMKRTVGGSTGGVGDGSSGANGSSPVACRSKRNSRTLRLSVCASQPVRNTALTLASVSGVVAPETEGAWHAALPVISANSAPVRLERGAERHLVIEEGLVLIVQVIAIAVIGETEVRFSKCRRQEHRRVERRGTGRVDWRPAREQWQQGAVATGSWSNSATCMSMPNRGKRARKPASSSSGGVRCHSCRSAGRPPGRAPPGIASVCGMVSPSFCHSRMNRMSLTKSVALRVFVVLSGFGVAELGAAAEHWSAVISRIDDRDDRHACLRSSPHW